MTGMTLRDPFPEEALLQEGKAHGLSVHIQTLSWFRIEMVAVIQQGRVGTVVRRDADVGARGMVFPKAEKRFACHRRLLGRLDRQLARLGAIDSLKESERSCSLVYTVRKAIGQY
jgi:hypothetical protein